MSSISIRFSFWAAVLFILPNCGFDASFDLGPGDNLDPGSPPHEDAIFCDIALERRCATPDDLAMGTRLASAAVALVEGQYGTNIGLDFRPAALANCGVGPEAVVFNGAFPRGTLVCVNCGDTIPGNHANAAAVCQAKCHDLFTTTTPSGTVVPQNPPTADTIAFCKTHAKLSTNFLGGCFGDACTTAGMLRDGFADPRRRPESVEWINLNGVNDISGPLTRTATTTGFADAGASSDQLIAEGDGYLEFTAAETNTARAAGLSSGAAPPVIVFTDIGFGILLLDTEIHAIVNGLSVGTFGSYVSGDRFRVKLRDNFDGTATVTFARVVGPCVDGSPCSEAAIEPPGTYTAPYPFRVDAMIREQGGTVTDARIVRIR